MFYWPMVLNNLCNFFTNFKYLSEKLTLFLKEKFDIDSRVFSKSGRFTSLCVLPFLILWLPTFDKIGLC